MTDLNAPIGEARPRIEAALVAQTKDDPAFRHLLLTDPHEALKTMLGFDPLPAHAVRVIEEQPGEIILVLPHALGLDELPDALLDIVSGSRPRADDGSVRDLCPDQWQRENPLPIDRR